MKDVVYAFVLRYGVCTLLQETAEGLSMYRYETNMPAVYRDEISSCILSLYNCANQLEKAERGLCVLHVPTE